MPRGTLRQADPARDGLLHLAHAAPARHRGAWSNAASLALVVALVATLLGACVKEDDEAVAVPGDIPPAPTLAVGYEHVVVVQPDGTLWRWGRRCNDRPENPSSIPHDMVPRRIGTDSDWAGLYSTELLRKQDDSIWSWNSALCVPDDQIAANLPTPLGDADWRTMSGGGSYTLAVRPDGGLWAWGANDVGQLGDGTTEAKASPVRIGNANDWQNVVAAGHSLSLRTDGTLWAWGDNTFGQLTYDSGPNTYSVTPGQVGTDADWASVTANFGFVVALKSDATAWAWGYNWTGQLGDGTTQSRSTPAQVGTDADWVVIAGGTEQALAIKGDGTLWGWGNNFYGQLGDGTRDTRLTPIQVGTDADWAAVGSGYAFAVGRKTDGSLWSWGDNTAGKLGIDGQPVCCYYLTPQPVVFP